MNHIVVGVDGSDGARAALRWAIREAALRAVPVHAVWAWTYPVPIGFPYAEMQTMATVDFQQRAEASLAVEIDKAQAEEGLTVEVKGHAVLAQPAEALLRASEDAALLVVGTRGRGGFAGVLLGSVSRQCAEHASCPIVIVPTPHS